MRVRRTAGLFGDGRRLVGLFDNREAGRAGIGERQGDGPVVIEPDDARDRDERRIEAAGSRGDDDVAGLERVAADLERPEVDRAVAAALADHRLAAAQDPRRNDVGAVGDQQDSRRQWRRHRSPGRSGLSAVRTGMPTRTPSTVPAERMAKRRGLLKEEPTMRPVGDRRSGYVRASCSAALQLAVFLRDRFGFDDPLQHQLAFVLQLRVLVRSVPIIAGAAEHAADRRRDRSKAAR